VPYFPPLATAPALAPPGTGPAPRAPLRAVDRAKFTVIVLAAHDAVVAGVRGSQVPDALPGGNVGPGGYRAGSWKTSQNWPIVVTGFAARERLTIVPAVPQHGYGPEVCLGPAVLDLPGLLELAGQLGGRVLYLHAAPG
jgi:hypothetical protein